MSTFYLDYEGGNDANDGTTFANRWKTFQFGATAARIGPGDTIRVMGSPALTSLGITGVWTNRVGGLAAQVAIESSTNATPIVVTKTAHGLSNGSTLVITAHATNTKANGTWEIANVTANTFELVGSTGNGVGGATGTYRLRDNSRVTLASALTTNIAGFANLGEGRVAWTASTNVVATLDTTDFKCADMADSIAIAAGFTTGLAAYFPTGTLNLSAKQQVSFWIKQTVGVLGAAASCSLTLCSDAAGVTTVNTINLPAFAFLGQWMPITVDTGGALGASIQSIGFVVNTDNGAQTFLLSNILACKAASSADSLTLTSLLGKNTGTETWYALQSINGTRVLLDMHVNAIPTTVEWRGYSGVTETVTTYKRETIKTTMQGSGADIPQRVIDSGTEGNLIAFEGGWDRTAMTTQNLETWYDGQNGIGTAIYIGSLVYVSLNLFGLVRYNNAVLFEVNCNYITIGTMAANNNVAGVVYSQNCDGHMIIALTVNNNAQIGFSSQTECHSHTITTIVAANNNGVHGVRVHEGSNVLIVTISAANNNADSGLQFLNANGNVVRTVTAKDNGSYGVSFTTLSGDNKILTGTTSDNGLASVSNWRATNYLRNFTMAEAIEVKDTIAFANSRIYSEKHDGTTDNHQIFTDGGLIRSETSVRHTASGISWALLPTSANRNSIYPLDLSLAKVACNANALVTIKAFMRRTNTGLTMRLVCKGAQLSGVATDVAASMTAAADTWEELTITFTPTEIGVVEITAEAYGGTIYTGYVDDLTIAQA